MVRTVPSVTFAKFRTICSGRAAHYRHRLSKTKGCLGGDECLDRRGEGWRPHILRRLRADASNVPRFGVLIQLTWKNTPGGRVNGCVNDSGGGFPLSVRDGLSVLEFRAFKNIHEQVRRAELTEPLFGDPQQLPDQGGGALDPLETLRCRGPEPDGSERALDHVRRA